MITTGVVCRDFIGRRFELDFLIERVAQAREQRGEMLLVLGDAGIGKTRLMHELAQALPAHGVRSVIGQCYEFGDAPYAPLLEIAEELGATAAIDALQSREKDREAASGRERMRRFAAFAAALAQAARSSTLVAIVENLQWGDIGTLELFNYLAGSLKEHHVVLIGTLRSEDIGTVGRATTQLRAAIERSADATIVLQALEPAEMRSLLTSVMRDDGRRVSGLVLDKIAELSDGRPFHAEELLRGMLDRHRELNDSANAPIPRSLGAAVQDRLVSLAESDRTVLAYAAVIGRRFDAPFLAELAAKPLSDVLLTLRRARNLQLIVEDADSDCFFFRHQLTREVVYEEILFAEARALHKRIAEELETRPGRDAAAIAYHAWRSGDRALAVTWNEVAGDAAAMILAHTDAIRHYDRAFNSTSAPAARFGLAYKIARALYAVGDLDGAAKWFEAAMTAATLADDRAAAHTAALDRALALWEHGSVDEGIAAAATVSLDLATEDSPLRFKAETLTASLLTATYRAAEALVHLDAASGLTCVPEPAWALRHRGIRAHTLARLGRLDESQAEFAAAVAGARALGDREQIVRALNNWADVRLRSGDLRGALANYKDGLDVARDLRATRLIAWLIANNAYTSLLLGELAAARALLAEFVTIDHDVEIIWIQSQAVLCRLGTLLADEALIRRSKIDEALARAAATGNRNALALTAGAALARHVLAGDDATAFAERMIGQIAGAADIFWFVDGVARAVPSLIPRARTMLADIAADEHAHAARAHLMLFDARVAVRERRKTEGEQIARDATAAFKGLGWAVEEAYAREAGGNVKDAIEAFRRFGALAEVTRLTTVDARRPRRRGETTLTTREREIASLIGAGKSNREVAGILVISERTVETHVAAVFSKFGITSRRELVALLHSATTPG